MMNDKYFELTVTLDDQFVDTIADFHKDELYT